MYAQNMYIQHFLRTHNYNSVELHVSKLFFLEEKIMIPWRLIHYGFVSVSDHPSLGQYMPPAHMTVRLNIAA